LGTLTQVAKMERRYKNSNGENIFGLTGVREGEFQIRDSIPTKLFMIRENK
jgi:hypothetical protein